MTNVSDTIPRSQRQVVRFLLVSLHISGAFSCYRARSNARAASSGAVKAGFLQVGAESAAVLGVVDSHGENRATGCNLAQPVALQNHKDPVVHGDQAFVPEPVDEHRDCLPGRSHHVSEILVRQS